MPSNRQEVSSSGKRSYNNSRVSNASIGNQIHERYQGKITKKLEKYDDMTIRIQVKPDSNESSS